MNSNNKICIVVATPLTAQVFLKDQIQTLSHHFKVSVVANFSQNIDHKINWDKIEKVDIPLIRPVSPVQDLITVFRLFFLFRKEKFCVVHSITPKAGLLSMVASFLAGIKVRIHTFTGQVWVSRRGILRWLFKNLDWFLSLLATKVYADSPSQRDFLIENKIVSSNKIKVLADGSIGGVDLKRFKPCPLARKKIRRRLALSEESVLILFLGRLNPDKGIADLVMAFKQIDCDRAHLMIVGPDECGMRNQLLKLADKSLHKIYFIDYTAEPEKYMAAADIFCLPSYREGFGSVVIEAAACGLPSVASEIYGLTDAVIDGDTGFLYPPGDISRLVSVLQKMVKNPMLRKKMGSASRIRVRNFFSQERLTQAVLKEYLAVDRGISN